jgi:hypothetical protein
VLIGVLFLIVIVSVMVLGMGQLAISHRQRADVESRYAVALDLAEAGINYELNHLTLGSPAHTAASPGTGSLGDGAWRGTFSVTCTNTDGTAIADPSHPPSTIYILSTGTANGVSRTVRIRARGGSAYDYGLFSKISGVINGNQTIQGSVGTSGTVTINGSNGITDPVIGLHGAGASATINPPGSYQTQVRPAIVWPTVAQVANSTVQGGLAQLAAVNDNGLATAYVNNGILNGSVYNNKTVNTAIKNASISANGTGTVTLHSKAGGANYYLNAMTFNGTWNVVLDNTLGPINIWCVSKTGAAATFVFNGGNASVRMDEDPSKACRVYVADKCSLTLNGNGQGRYGVYAINDDPTGTVTLNGNNDLYGSVICNKYTFNGVNGLHYTAGYFSSGPGDWSFDTAWVEVAGQ